MLKSQLRKKKREVEMTNHIEDRSQLKKNARIAGFWYLLASIPAPIGLLYVPSKLIVPADATATANNILAAESLFRIGIVSNLLSQILFIFAYLALYRLLKGVNQQLASLMVALALVSVPIEFLNMLNPLAALLLLSDARFLDVFEPNQLHALVMVFLNLQDYGTFIVQIFWGLWLLPFGLLVFKSGFLPKMLGVLLIIAGFGYVVDSFTFLLFPHYRSIVALYAGVLEFGELPMILWLLIKGVTDQQTQKNLPPKSKISVASQ